MPYVFKPKESYPALDFMDDEDEVTTGEIAQILEVGIKTPLYWLRMGWLKGRIDSTRRGGRNGMYMVRACDLRAFLKVKANV